MPALFLGHGNPLYAIVDSAYGRAWASLGRSLPRPRAVVCVSAHWYVGRTAVTAAPQPRTIHDFGGFPPELYEVQYPAPGEPALADRVAQMLQPTAVDPDPERGLDHGAWSVLRHLYPDADVPVIQLAIDRTQPADRHFELAKKLVALRDEGVLIVGSGNVIHNLREYAWKSPEAKPPAWATRFEAIVRRHLDAGDVGKLIDYTALGKDASKAVPTPDHYLPLLYVLAQCVEGDRITYPVDGFDGGSTSMLAVQIGKSEE